MAILKDGTDEYEVRIKRYPDGTYFDEYVSTREREKSEVRNCDRFIIGEGDVTYTIDMTLKKGFNFVGYSHVRARLYIPGQEDSVSCIDLPRPLKIKKKTTIADVSESMKYADVVVGDRKMLQTRFAFRSLVPGELLHYIVHT